VSKGGKARADELRVDAAVVCGVGDLPDTAWQLEGMDKTIPKYGGPCSIGTQGNTERT